MIKQDLYIRIKKMKIIKKSTIKNFKSIYKITDR